MCPGGVTFGVIGSSFFVNVPNGWLNSYGNFGGATPRRFSLAAKNLRGRADNRPPAVRWFGFHMSVFVLNFVTG